jgi:ligand-binding sensor domain-containing protein
VAKVVEMDLLQAPTMECFIQKDGVNFQTISTSFLNLVDNRVNCIFRENNCIRRVVGTKGGLSYCPEGLNCQNYTTANGLPQNDIVSISQDCKGNFWIGTRDSGLVVHNGIQFQRVTTTNGLTSNYIKSITFTSECEALVGLGDGNIAVVDTSKNVLDILSNIRDLVEYMSVRVYPQPAHQQVYFEFSETINGCFYFHPQPERTAGEAQRTFTNCKRSCTLNVEAMAQGLYFYTIKSHGEMIKSGKLFIE